MQKLLLCLEMNPQEKCMVLIRVRQFTISEGHLVVRPDQLEEEFKGVVDLINYMMKTLGIEEDVTYQIFKMGSK